jgi:hypothetical protein
MGRIEIVDGELVVVGRDGTVAKTGIPATGSYRRLEGLDCEPVENEDGRFKFIHPAFGFIDYLRVKED